jgi:hypothetical protein
MKKQLVFIALAAISLASLGASAQTSKKSTKHLYIDVHHFGAGKVTYADVEKAHAKDLAVEKKYGVDLQKFWVDEVNGDVYCLASASDSNSIRKTHAEAHGLLPDQILEVTSGKHSAIQPGRDFFLDIHRLGAGKVTPKDVAGAHEKDLAAEGKHGVNFVDYWVNPKSGTVVCLSQAQDSTAVIATHKDAHGLLPAQIMKVKQGE